MVKESFVIISVLLYFQYGQILANNAVISGTKWLYYSWICTQNMSYFITVTSYPRSEFNPHCEKSMNFSINTQIITIISDSCDNRDSFEVRIHHEFNQIQLYLLNIRDERRYNATISESAVQRTTATRVDKASCDLECYETFSTENYNGRCRKTITGETCRHNENDETDCKPSMIFDHWCYKDNEKNTWDYCRVPVCNSTYNKVSNCLSIFSTNSDSHDLRILFENLSLRLKDDFIYAIAVRTLDTKRCVNAHWRVASTLVLLEQDLLEMTEYYTDVFTECEVKNVTFYNNRTVGVYSYHINRIDTSGIYEILMFVYTNYMKVPLFSMAIEGIVYPVKNKIVVIEPTTISSVFTQSKPTIFVTTNQYEDVQEYQNESVVYKGSRSGVIATVVVVILIILCCLLSMLYKLRRKTGAYYTKKHNEIKSNIEMRNIRYKRSSSRYQPKWFTSSLRCSDISSNKLDLEPELLEEEFDRLEAEARRYESKNQLKYQIASSPINASKNRYKNILPYDTSRVILRDFSDVDSKRQLSNIEEEYCNSPLMKASSDYINASYIFRNSFIACQAPKRETLGDFWSMIWQEKISMIIMLTNLIEKNIAKSEIYWPENAGQTVKYSRLGYNVSVTLLNQEARQGFVVRDMECSLDSSDESYTHKVTQVHYIDWPDHGVPNVIDFSNFMTFCFNHSQSKKSNSPMLVHCSAGVGRTGTFICCWSYHNRLAKMTNESQRGNAIVDIYRDVLKMRRSRPNMVQTATQYRFIYVYAAYLAGDESE